MGAQFAQLVKEVRMHPALSRGSLTRLPWRLISLAGEENHSSILHACSCQIPTVSGARIALCSVQPCQAASRHLWHRSTEQRII